MVFRSPESGTSILSRTPKTGTHPLQAEPVSVGEEQAPHGSQGWGAVARGGLVLPVPSHGCSALGVTQGCEHGAVLGFSALPALAEQEAMRRPGGVHTRAGPALCLPRKARRALLLSCVLAHAQQCGQGLQACTESGCCHTPHFGQSHPRATPTTSPGVRDPQGSSHPSTPQSTPAPVAHPNPPGLKQEKSPSTAQLQAEHGEGKAYKNQPRKGVVARRAEEAGPRSASA